MSNIALLSILIGSLLNMFFVNIAYVFVRAKK